MSNDIKSTTIKKGKERILFTGGANIVIDNLIDHISENYQMVKCSPLESDFLAALNRIKPHLLIICLHNETREMLRMYEILVNDERYKKLPVIVIGREDNCLQFKQTIVLKNIKIFVRPMDMNEFIETVNRIATLSFQLEKVKEEKKETENMITDGENVSKNLTLQEKSDSQKSNSTLPDNRKSILVVDDDVRMLNVIKLYLQDLYDVTVVPNGKLALKFLLKKSVDLVLLDYMMPEMDGPTVLAQLRNAPRNSKVPVLFLTGVSDKEMVLRILDYRPNGYLLKPVTRETLLDRVTEILLGI